jgi:membrane-associated phospholipid phosphatase
MQQRVFRLVGGAAVGIGAAGALLLATDVLDRVARWDVSAYRGLRVLAGHPDVSGGAHRVVHLADPVPTAAMLAAICGAGLACGRPRHAGGALLLVGGASLTSLALKVALAHPRYQSLLGPRGLAAEAFPSGHATTAMAVGLAGVLVAAPRWRLAAAIGAAFYGLAGGLSVVIIGWHYPSDVLGAFLVSGSFGLLSVAALRATDGEPKAHRALTWPFGRPFSGIDGTLVALTGGAAGVALAVTLSEGDKLLSWAAANTSAVVAATGIALLSAVLVYGVAAEANGS